MLGLSVVSFNPAVIAVAPRDLAMLLKAAGTRLEIVPASSLKSADTPVIQSSNAPVTRRITLQDPSR
jgi:hypothetical protein